MLVSIWWAIGAGIFGSWLGFMLAAWLAAGDDTKENRK